MKTTFLTILTGCFLSIQANTPQSDRPIITTWQNDKQAAICYTFDDACPNQFTTAIPILDRYKAPATFFVAEVFNPDWNVLKQVCGNGHEVASHTLTHCNLNDSVAANEYRESNQLIFSKTGEKVHTLAYPYCNAPSDSITEKYYIGARICSGQIEKATPDNFMRISSIVVGSESSLTTGEELTKLFDKTLQQKGCCILLIHEIDNGPGYSPLSSEALEQSLEYTRKNPAFWITTFKDYICYAKERDNAKIKEIRRSRKEISFTVNDNLPNDIYKTPVTVSYPLPSNWSEATVTCEGKEIEAEIVDHKILINVVPDTGIVTIKKK
ncbi:polysaccharide deacetylase family protein [uncultured Bacteroides sp.]|uniref:polysaccharide deacetylase family protein n=1 Tax=uncultured Bacteroides sp. TaxID=162156 RepID=UPI002616CE54|nr:polysaccharide deacetylase family protein [uncultured Bacteroides sp.]